VIVIGVGNEFRHDDGAGPAAIAALRGRLEGVTLAVTDGEPARLIELWAGADHAIVIDAVRAEPPKPGRIHELELPTVAELTWPAVSSHALGLGEAVELARAVDQLPERLLIYAIEGEDFSLGPGLTPAVAAAVTHVADHIATLDT
jgi:hydrogenase maturation protease